MKRPSLPLPTWTEGRERLRLFGFPLIENIRTFSRATHVSEGLLWRLCRSTSDYYRTVIHEVSSDKSRTLHCPDRRLALVQRWILRRILDRLSPAPYATAYVPEKNIAHHLSPHLGNLYLLVIDIENFFPSIRFDQVRNVFDVIGFPSSGANLLSYICTLDHRLPEGAVTSPSLSNLVFSALDRRIADQASVRNVVYTRYCDDLTFSAEDVRPLLSLRPIIQAMLRKSGFTINKHKTRLGRPGGRRVVCGLAFRGESFGVTRNFKRKVRAMIHNTSLLAPDDESFNRSVRRIRGMASYLHSVDEVRERQLRKYASELGVQL